MKEYTLVVYSNAAPGRDQEFNDWYNDVHLKDVTGVPGIVSARRLKLAEFSLDPTAAPPAYRYIALYTLASDDPQAVLDDMRGQVETGRIALTEAMQPDFLAYCYEAASPQVNAER